MTICKQSCCCCWVVCGTGIRNKHNMTDCHETANEICKVWPGTTQTCTYKYSGKDKVCREPHGACDVKEYCKLKSHH
jgi:hypothetical protein